MLFGISKLIGHLRVRGTGPTNIVDVSPEMDEVELVGTARPVVEPFEAPFTRQQAMAYSWEIRIDEKPDAWSYDTAWSKFGEDRQPFILDDGTGKILVDPEGAAMDLDRDETWTVSKGEQPPEGIRQYLEESDSSEVVYDGLRQFSEGHLSPSGDVYVYGPIKAGPAEDAPKGTVRPYIGSDQLHQKQNDSDSGFSYDLTSMTDVFTFSNTGEKEVQDTLLSQGVVLIGVGLLSIAIAMAVAFL